MTISSPRLIAAGLFLAAGLPLATAGHAQTRSVNTHPTTHKAKSVRGTPSSPAPTEHQAVPPSERLKDEPNQIKEQVAPVPDAPVKPGSNVSPGQDTPHRR